MGLTREQILTACKRQVVTVDVPALGGPVHLRALTGAEAAAVHRGVTEPSKRTEAMVAVTLCDEAGARILTIADAEELFDKPVGVLNGLVGKALEVNRMTQEASDAARKD